MTLIEAEARLYRTQMARLQPGGRDAMRIAVTDLASNRADAVSAAYIPDLIAPTELRTLAELVLQSGPVRSVEQICSVAELVMPSATRVRELKPLIAGLHKGAIAIHLDGHPAAILVWPPAGSQQESFGPDLAANRRLMGRALHSPSLRLRSVRTEHGGRAAVAYLAGVTDPATVDEVARWAVKLSPKPPTMTWWRALLGLLRLPPIVSTTAPPHAADALRRGYAVVLADHLQGAQIAPASLALLLEGPNDTAMQPPFRRLAIWARVTAAGLGLLPGPAFVAITSYHHSLIPGPFLMALLARIENHPFPVITEIALVFLLDDALAGAANRFGQGQGRALGLLGTILAAIAAIQAGALMPMSVMVGVMSAVWLQVIAETALVSRLRLWRFFFLLAAFGLGMYGVALLLFALAAYLGEESWFGHPIHDHPELVRS